MGFGKIIWLLVAVSGLSTALPTPYDMFDGHIVLRAVPTTEAQLEALHLIEQNGFLIDFWSEPRKVNQPVDMRLSPEQQNSVLEYLKKFDIETELRIGNLKSLVERELAELEHRKPFNQGDHPNTITTNQYHTYDDIMAYLDSVANTYSDMASTVPIGSSYENRDLKAIKLGKPGSNKPAVWIDGGIHAREWITHATVVYIIHELTANQAQYSNLLNALDIYLMPVVNPDGYEYTWTTNRMWRKTRSGPRSGCYGVDPNRNWNYQWMVAGSSSNPCSETYAGPSAGSEVEVQSVENFLRQNKDALRSYFNLHAYSEDWCYPYGYADNTYPLDVNELRALSSQAVDAIAAVNGVRFSYGSITDIVYPASGSSIDYTKGVLNIKYSFAMELRPGKFSFNGFQLPESQIVAGASETWAGIQVVLMRVANGQL